MRIPGSRCLPNGELVHRIDAVAPSGSEPVVVTCAGRTRGLLGALSLRLVGHKGPVHALENGTQGWFLAGFDLERGGEPPAFPALDAGHLLASRERADHLVERFGISRIEPGIAGAMLGNPDRTTYLLDVRSDSEVRAGHVAAAVHAPGGQLVQATDRWIGVRRARLLLCDDGGLRAPLAAFWLKQLGFDAAVVTIDENLRALAPRVAPKPARLAQSVTAARALRRLVRSGARLLDLRSSLEHRRGHVAGAIWAIRPRFASQNHAFVGRDVLVVSETRAVADLAAHDLMALGAGRILWVEGGHNALVAEGAAVERSPRHPSAIQAIDHLLFAHDRHHGNRDAARLYLDWETGLIARLDAAERAEFNLIEPAR